jgi:hypothetical protein
MDWIAAASFRASDRLLSDRQYAAAPLVKTLGIANARTLLRYQTAEQNRNFFETWETAQLFLGLALFLYMLFGTTERQTPLIIVLVMIAMAALQRFIITPDLNSIARGVEFARLGGASAESDKFWALHSAYTTVEVLKWGFAIALTIRMLLHRRRGRSSDTGDEFDVVDKPNYRHVNR